MVFFGINYDTVLYIYKSTFFTKLKQGTLYQIVILFTFHHNRSKYLIIICDSFARARLMEGVIIKTSKSFEIFQTQGKGGLSLTDLKTKSTSINSA